MPFTLPAAEIVALFMQAVGYGAHMITFSACMSKMLSVKMDGRRHIQWPLFAVALALFTIGTLDIAVHLYQTLDAFVYYTGKGGAAVIFSHFSSWPNVVRTTSLMIGAMISDGAWIYRCWVIYGRRWVAVSLPMLLWVGIVIAGSFQIFWQATLEKDLASADLLSSKMFQRWVVAFAALSLVLNTITTSMIVYKIWSVSRGVVGFSSANVRSSRLTMVMEVVIESALLYTLDVFITFVADVSKSLIVYGFASLGLELAGVAYDLIIIRLGSTHTGSSIAPDRKTNGSSGPRFALRVLQSSVTEQRTDGSVFNEATSQTKSDVSMKDPSADMWQTNAV